MIYTIEDFEEFLASLTLNKTLFSVKTVEFDLKWDLNPTNDLNYLFFDEQKFLWFEEFFEYYTSRHIESLKPLILRFWKADFLRWLEARIYRTQFWFLTEYHAYFKCLSIFPKGSVIRNPELDKKWIDFQIKHGGEVYNIHVFVDTERAWKFREFKRQSKHVDDYPWNHVNFPYYLWRWKINSVEYLPNWFWIYTEKYVKFLKDAIDSWILIWKTIVWVGVNNFVFL